MIAVVLPAYDEAGTIGTLLSQVPSRMAGHPVVAIVVDDGSSDGTAPVAERCGARVVRLPANRGKAAAIATGRVVAAHLGAAVVVEMDADGQHDPAHLSAVVAPVVQGRADLVIGSRYLHDGGRGPTPRNRYLVRTLTSRLLDVLLQQPASDPFSGYRCYRSAIIRDMRLTARRYDGELELRFEAARCGARVAEVAVPRIYGPATSKMHRRGGAFLGRLLVLGQYGAAMVTGTWRLMAQRPPSGTSGACVAVDGAPLSGAIGDG